MTALIIAVIYYFKEIISGNIDLMYILTGILFIESLTKGRKLAGKTILAFLPIFIWAVYQCLLIENLDILRLTANIFKIFTCLFLFNYTREMYAQSDIKRIISYICMFFIISVPVSLIFKTQRLWSLNDMVNEFSRVRLKLFYFEPSELSFQVCIIVIFLIYFILSGENIRKNMFLLIGVLPVAILSYGFGGIMCLCVSLLVMSLIYISRNLRPKDFIKAYSMMLLFFTAIGATAYVGGALIQRAAAIFQGNDGSVMYRLNTGWEVMLKALENTKGIGIGFGNLNTSATQSAYSIYGLVDVIANSFMYFISEGGVFAIIYLLIFHIYVFKNLDREYLLLKLPLLLFIVLYQIAGGYFTNPMNWIVYGVVCANLKEYKTVNINYKGSWL